MPGVRRRREVVTHLHMAFATDDVGYFTDAIRWMAQAYEIPYPKVYLRNRIRANRAGQCFEDGRIDILKPAVWKREGRSAATWVHMVLHEFGHYYLWANAEPKAELFARRWVRNAGV